MTQQSRRSLIASVAVMGGLLVAGLVAIALGADAVSLVFVAAVVAVAFMVIVGIWFVPMQAELRRWRRHQRRVAARRHRAGAHLTKATVDAAEMRHFRQLEALLWLRDELDLAQPLPPTRGYAVAPDMLLELVRTIDRTAPGSVVELGSGVSTLVIARRLQQAGRGRVLALEHLPEYAQRTREAITELGLDEVAVVVTAPLTEVTLEDTTWSWYELGPDVPEIIDLLFVDGPPGSTGPLARYPALPMLRDRLAPGAVVLADDGAREDEAEMARRWAAEAEGSELRYLPLNKGAWCLTMPPAPTVESRP